MAKETKTTKETKGTNAMPAVLSYDKKLAPSFGAFYGTTWGERRTHAVPLKLQEKSVRGTISNRLKKALKDDPAKLDAEIEKANLQRVDSCALTTDQDTLKLTFTLKVLGNIQTPSSCDSSAFRQSYGAAVNAYITEEGFRELGRRYAINIANGRFLWRNRVGAQQVEIEVKALGQKEPQIWVFDGLSISTRNFNDSSADIESLAAKISEALSSIDGSLLLEINAYVLMGSGQDVYPSQELIFDKSNSKSKKSKILYEPNGVAGMHSEKLGNAIRTIDTWYPEFQEAQVGPIAIEVYGAVTNLGRAFRAPKEKVDFYTLFDNFSRGIPLASKNDEHYVMAMLIRGGVFGAKAEE
jgi:CRISPR-associated protein Csy3